MLLKILKHMYVNKTDSRRLCIYHLVYLGEVGGRVERKYVARKMCVENGMCAGNRTCNVGLEYMKRRG